MNFMKGMAQSYADEQGARFCGHYDISEDIRKIEYTIYQIFRKARVMSMRKPGSKGSSNTLAGGSLDRKQAKHAQNIRLFICMKSVIHMSSLPASYLLVSLHIGTFL